MYESPHWLDKHNYSSAVSFIKVLKVLTKEKDYTMTADLVFHHNIFSNFLKRSFPLSNP